MLVLAACAAILTGCVGDSINLSTMFLRPTPDMVGSPSDFGFTYDDLMVPIADDRAVSIWHVRADNPKGIVVVIPGSDRNKSRYLIALPVFVPHGYDVVLMDYEGFGDSTPTPPKLEYCSEDGLAVVDYALTQHEHVIAFGISTGGATAVRAAAERDLAALMLEAPLVLEHEVDLWLQQNGIFDKGLVEIAESWVHPQIPEEFDILTSIAHVDEPKLIMHSVEDEVVPFAAGVFVYLNASEPKTFYQLKGRHGKMVELEPELYTATVTGWLDETLAD